MAGRILGGSPAGAGQHNHPSVDALAVLVASSIGLIGFAGRTPGRFACVRGLAGEQRPRLRTKDLLTSLPNHRRMMI